MADVATRNEGSVILFTPLSPAGKEWADENLHLESWQWMGNSFGVEDQFAEAVLNGMMEDGLEIEGDFYKTGATIMAPPVAAPSVATPAHPSIPSPAQPMQPQRPAVGESVSMTEQPEAEKHTVPPELPNALFHMASVGEKVAVMNIGVLARKQASGDVIQAPSFAAANAIALRDFERHQNKVVTAVEILASPEPWKLGDAEPKNTEVFHLDEPIKVRVLNTPALTLMNWVGDEYLMPYWNVTPIGKVPLELRGYKSFWIYGQSYSVPADKPMTYEEASAEADKHINDLPDDYSEADKLRLHGLGVQAKLAGRGGWHRVSKSTVQSDDKRFTITEVDPTRRKNWFMLKDLETGLSYNLPTMTGAKKKAKGILEGSATEEEAPVEPAVEEQPSTPVIATFKNALLHSKK